jgi:type I restriction enzyme R subunit
LDKEQFNALIEAYIFSGQKPIKDDVIKCLGEMPSVLKRHEIATRILRNMSDYVEVFLEGMYA